MGFSQMNNNNNCMYLLCLCMGCHHLLCREIVVLLMQLAPGYCCHCSSLTLMLLMLVVVEVNVCLWQLICMKCRFWQQIKKKLNNVKSSKFHKKTKGEKKENRNDTYCQKEQCRKCLRKKAGN